MPGAFFESFNPVLPDMEAQFTEDWTLNGATWPAIAIETQDESSHTIKGGVLQVSTTRIIIRQAIFEQSGVAIGDFVSARGFDMFVGSIESDGDASKTLVCTSKGLDIWR